MGQREGQVAGLDQPGAQQASKWRYTNRRTCGSGAQEREKVGSFSARITPKGDTGPARPRRACGEGELGVKDQH